jgi:SAM-dependent methyltransferase
MAVEKRDAFNQVAELYDVARLRYPAQLFNDLIDLSSLPEGGRILEVGAGTGIATLPLAQRGYRIVAVDLGEGMAAVARDKLAKFDNVDVVVSSFEDWPLPNEPFDLVMSATAWHWIDPDVGYAKAAEALRPGGALAIFKYHHIAGDDGGFFRASQSCYERYTAEPDADFRLPTAAEVVADVENLEASRLFAKPLVRTYEVEETFTREQYVDLLSTFSPHRQLKEETRRKFLYCVGSLIDRKFGGQIRKQFLHELIVASVKPTDPPADNA